MDYKEALALLAATFAFASLAAADWVPIAQDRSISA